MNLRMCAGKMRKPVLPFWAMESSVVCIWLEGAKVSHLTSPKYGPDSLLQEPAKSAHLLTDDCIVSAAWSVHCVMLILPIDLASEGKFRVSFEQWRRGELDCKGLSPVACGHIDLVGICGGINRENRWLTRETAQQRSVRPEHTLSVAWLLSNPDSGWIFLFWAWAITYHSKHYKCKL